MGSLGLWISWRQVFPINSYRIKVAFTRIFTGFWQHACPIIACVLILALDTSSPAGSIAALQNEKVIGTVSTSTTEIYSSRMFRHLDFLLTELSLNLGSFDVFAVAAGPGSFTGLRVGLATAKGWAEVYRKPIAAVSNLEAVAAQQSHDPAVVVPVLNAHRGQVYFARYRRTGEGNLALEGEECVASPDECLEAVLSGHDSEKITIAATEPELMTRALERYRSNHPRAGGIWLECASPILAPYIGILGLQRSQTGELSDPLTLDANYVRRSDAELKWKAPSGI